jgi:hypothetical protein
MMLDRIFQDMKTFSTPISRSFVWRLMILASVISLCLGLFFGSFRGYSWISTAFSSAAIIVLHPVMDRDLPNLFGSDLLRSARTYIGVILVICSVYYNPGCRMAIDMVRSFGDRN